MQPCHRRAFLLSGTSALLTACHATGGKSSFPVTKGGNGNLGTLVDPFIGTGGHGHTYPGASVPFGMVQVSPDTDNTRWDSVSGYHIDDPTMLGFSHTHLSGTGVGDMLDVLLRPGQGRVTLDPGSLMHPQGSYRARFRHEDEQAEPGYYRVRWPDEGIVSELTATGRAGMQRYHFERDGEAFVLLDFTHGIRTDNNRPTRVHDASLCWSGALLSGSRMVSEWASGREICFALEFSPTPHHVAFFVDDQPAADGTTTVSGTSLKAVCHFGRARDIITRTGISSVDVNGAKHNLATEITDWDFDGVRARARAEWESYLQRIGISGATSHQHRIMRTAMYHALLGPTRINDCDGRYRGLDRQVHTLPPGRKDAYSTYSIWDTYRAEHPLLTLLCPERVPDIVQSLVEMMKQSGGQVPVWPLQDVDTQCMTGYHAASVVSEAANKGFGGIEYAAAWRAIRRRAFASTDGGMGEYRHRGWIPADRVGESTSRTVEYSFDDWAAAQLATRNGARADARTLLARCHSYRNLYDSHTGFIRPRLASGRWAEPFSANEMGHSGQWRDYTESNPWQATLLAQHDVYGMMDMMGGEGKFLSFLDGIFAANPALPPDAPPDISGQMGQYAHGNEPSHHIAYLYAYAGRPWQTQDRVRMIQTQLYAPRPDGMAGNEDVGQMSAWFILSALGFYPVDPTTGIYVFGSPLFTYMHLQTTGARALVIEAPEASDTRRFIRGVSWNGQPWTKSWISHQQLANGGVLHFDMADEPNYTFGKEHKDRPPSLGRT